MKNILIVIVLLFVSWNLNAQVSKPGKISSSLEKIHRNAPSGRIQSRPILIKKVDNAAELKRANEIAERCADCKRDFYGTGVEVDIDLKKASVESFENGKLWSVTVESTGAFALQFYFSRFRLPEGSELFFKNSEGTMSLGSFGSHNNHEDGKFATQTIAGDVVTIYYYEPNEVSFSGELKIEKVIHAFKEIYKSGFGSSQSCNIDVNCP